jgi:hypothetical protein
MVVSVNGVKPYTIQRRRAILKFSDPSYEGMHIEARLDIDLRTYLELQALATSVENNTDNLRAAFSMFGDAVLESWNLQDEDGTVLSPDAAGFLSLPPALGTAILGAWSESVITPGEVSASA